MSSYTSDAGTVVTAVNSLGGNVQRAAVDLWARGTLVLPAFVSGTEEAPVDVGPRGP